MMLIETFEFLLSVFAVKLVANKVAENVHVRFITADRNIS